MSSSDATQQAYARLKTVLDDIKALKIQGATNVALEGVSSFAHYAVEVAPSFSNHKRFMDHLRERAHEVKTVRITEPALANGLSWVLNQIDEQGLEAAIGTAEEFRSRLTEAKVQVGKIGAEKIQEGTTIMTHCHSSFVDQVFWQAKDMGKSFRVVNTETRPLYQGRKTVRKLREKEIEVIHVVDSAMWWAMSKFDVELILTGADAVTVEGVALNKIGSRLLALSARELHVPLYVCTSLLKYNPETVLGRRSEIEMRESAEIWPDHPEGVSVYNPAFETIAGQYISAFITEYGLIPSQMMAYEFDRQVVKGLFLRKD